MFSTRLLHIYFKQECIPVGCVPPTLCHIGGLPDRDPTRQRPHWTENPYQTETPLDSDPPPDRDPLGQRPLFWTNIPSQSPPWTETHLDRDPPPGQRPHSWTETPLLARDPQSEITLDRDPLHGQRPPPGQRTPWTQTPPWTQTSPVNRITDKCKNITFQELRLQAVITTQNDRKKFLTVTVLWIGI